MKKLFTLMLLLLFSSSIVFSISACNDSPSGDGDAAVKEGDSKKEDEPKEGASGEISLKKQIVPLMAKHGCTGGFCHSASKKAAGLDLETDPRKAMLDVDGKSGKKMIVAGKPEESYLIDKITNGKDIKGKNMPIGKPEVPSEDVKLISDWIKQGAKDN